MNNNMVYNEETSVPKTFDMNDRDYLNCVLEAEKDMSNNLSYVLNEVSNDKLFDDVYEIFDEVKNYARDAYDLAFKNGWYKLEKAEDTKITQKITELNEKLNELNSENSENENS